MGFFCATCPQPGVNLPDDWNKDPNHPDNWKYTRGFVADGNFTAAHQKQAQPEDDVWLKDGDSFMTQRGPYLSHLWDAIEDYDVSLFVLALTLRFMQLQLKTCNEHDAVNNKNVFH